MKKKIIYLQDPKLTLHPSIPLLSIVLCPVKEGMSCQKSKAAIKNLYIYFNTLPAHS